MLNISHPVENKWIVSVRPPMVMAGMGVLAGILIAVPAYVFLWRVYSWQLGQPETIQGAIELIAVFLILALSAALIRIPRVCSLSIIGVAALYLQLHSVLVSAAAAWLFLEFLIQAGGALQRFTNAEDFQDADIPSYLSKFLVGVALWTSGALLLSAFGWGSIPHLRLYTIIWSIASIAVARGTPLSIMLIRRFERMNSKDKLSVIFLAVLILTQFGKANYGNDYDSLWYGLRPEAVLVGPHSLFDNLKLMHNVYYYPKQFEVLTLPLANLNHGAFIVPFNVTLLALGFLAIFQIVRELNIDRSGAFLFTALAASIPAFSNMASTAKTDNLTSLYAFLAALFLWRWCRENRAADLSYGLAAILGMVGTKISAYAYAPLLALGFLAVGFWIHYGTKQKAWFGAEFPVVSRAPARKTAPMVMLVVAISAYIGLTLRTWLLTGIPTMPAFVDKWKLLGFSPKYPWSISGFVFASVPIENTKEFFVHWYRLLVNPELYSHYVMAWPGNAGFFFCFAVLILAAARMIGRGPQTAFLISCLPVIAGGIITVCVVRTPNQGFTDGNYYAIPMILTILAAAGVLALSPLGIQRAMKICASGFLLVQLPIMFVSHWSWHPGTRAFRFDLNKSLFDRGTEIEAKLKKAGAWELEEYLKAHPGKGLCVGFSNGEEGALHMLSCVHEDFEQSGPLFWRFLESKASFRQYLAWAHPDLLIMPKSLSYTPCGPGTPIRLVFEELAQEKDMVRVESRNYIALDLSGVYRGEKAETGHGNQLR